MPKLNDSDKIYKGTQEIDKVFLGSEQLWPSNSNPPVLISTNSNWPNGATDRTLSSLISLSPSDLVVLVVGHDDDANQNDYEINGLEEEFFSKTQHSGLSVFVGSGFSGVTDFTVSTRPSAWVHLIMTVWANASGVSFGLPYAAVPNGVSNQIIPEVVTSKPNAHVLVTGYASMPIYDPPTTRVGETSYMAIESRGVQSSAGSSGDIQVEFAQNWTWQPVNFVQMAIEP